MAASPSALRLVREPEELSRTAEELRRAGTRIGCVPTMGALHAGHASLIERARRECASVVVTIFVNPKQFDDQADLEAYPRMLEADLELCRAAGATLVFAPSAEALYPPGFQTMVEVGPLAQVLCGLSRPGHFRGVTTVVAKLLLLVRPDRAYFGMKDFQQLQLVRRMARDLNFPVEIVACPTVREPDGLALSSRNARLAPAARARAPELYRALEAARRRIAAGAADALELCGEIAEALSRLEGAELDYVAVVDPETLEDVARIQGEVLVATAVFLDGVRLIDNVLARPGGTPATQ